MLCARLLTYIERPPSQLRQYSLLLWNLGFAAPLGQRLVQAVYFSFGQMRETITHHEARIVDPFDHEFSILSIA
jgi:hypothetical protein